MEQPVLSVHLITCLLQRKAGADCVGVGDGDAPIKIFYNY